MRSFIWLPATAVLAALAEATTLSTLEELCTESIAQAALPPSEFIQGLTIDASSVTTNIVTNDSVSGNDYPNAVISYCNVTLAYSHDGIEGDQVLLEIWLPAPSDFQNRWLSTGGGGYAINSGDTSLPGGIIYGAASGMTDGGFGGFSDQADTALLLANGTLNYEALYMFAFKAHHELSAIGKAFTRNIYGLADSTKLYSYYQGCSEGGREGWSQVQRYGDEWDGAVIGAPAFRWSFQQTQHLYSNIVEQTLNHYPSPCEFDFIVNATITACDPLDGKTDGVVARTDLCLLDYNITTLIGETYSCAASRGSPAVNGTLTAETIEVAQTILDGLHDSEGRRVYFSYQPSAAFDDAETQYNSTTGEWELNIDQLGGEYIALLVNKNGTTLSSLEGVTYDTLKDWMISGLLEYWSTLQTTWPDLTPYHNAGGKIIHYHGDADYSIPTASSVRFWESVRTTMYPGQDYNTSSDALKDWYRLYTVPGAGHCAPNDAMPNGPWPQTNLGVMIDWVEKGVVPTTLNATVLQGENQGQNQQLCAWPLRPLWVDGGETQECVYDQRSIDSWHYDLDAVPVVVY
ncbi:tannase and feruloyl esterase [Aspergillus heteromorphus CBS 117.55]|uniref:Carboxylic ester hydrolase n=1 Tax=Aspergillus heteromorphus CBS 117.55 TaxID=1448321 RepID=A0A317WKW4_9EURO|nr:tannase and feruloyl esterase [Aspergillus heteromorphus CBS 117.55]PWY85942.1 tannase and feruloyl esterase [Aspergillus heteromorphus CBS 117.55]